LALTIVSADRLAVVMQWRLNHGNVGNLGILGNELR
jgi:hypothetical protein